MRNRTASLHVSVAALRSRQWQRCDRAGRHCVMIEGATSSVLKVAARDAHDRLGVIVTAHNSAGSTRKLSALTAAVKAKA
jgi:hypothetical protein